MIGRDGIVTLLVLVIILSLVFLLYSKSDDESQPEEVDTDVAADAFAETTKYSDFGGNVITLEDYQEKTVIALAWASWCPGCAEQLRVLGDIAIDNDDIEILAVNRGEPLTTASSYLEYYDLNDRVTLIMDSDDHFFQSIEGVSVPELVVFSPTGEIVHSQNELINQDELRVLLIELDL